MSREFRTYTEADAPERTRPLLSAVRAAQHFLPEAVARQAESPFVVAQVLALLKAFGDTSLGFIEREVVSMVMARENDCELCRAMHTALLTRENAPPLLIAALREGAELEDIRLEALASFVRSALLGKGDVGAKEWRAFLAAGFTREQALEVVFGIAVYTLSTFANRLVQAPVDEPLARFR